ncbi:rhomboid family intramembrane serine protease [Lentilactobacillus fungorum]|uniref:Rhomboid family intramembrane serine protease n=1 Tax=Lentilactobacillus fungorum TaxID=2201250 RepID=A0ABQ3VXE8_9LACO|nr:rhomboid family intramembrane serine protease [Lentilactobacillus fungorum]GHP12887.1 rhomboid family intramembrane serine protease [Lentilactobacillus fungorum]
MTRLKDQPYVTYGLLAMMIVVFLIMSIMGGTTDPMTLVNFGAKYNPAIRAGQYWRLVTPIFIHIGFTHILMNGITLYFIGMYVEQLFGHLRFLVIFLVSGIVGNLASFTFSVGLSAGASTAIFGLFGAFMMLGESFSNNPAISSMARTFLLFIVLNIGTDIFVQGIDIAGHIGGLIGGFLVAYVVGVSFGKVSSVKRLIAGAMLLVIAVGLFVLGMQGNL